MPAFFLREVRPPQSPIRVGALSVLLSPDAVVAFCGSCRSCVLHRDNLDLDREFPELYHDLYSGKIDRRNPYSQNRKHCGLSRATDDAGSEGRHMPSDLRMLASRDCGWLQRASEPHARAAGIGSRTLHAFVCTRAMSAGAAPTGLSRRALMRAKQADATLFDDTTSAIPAGAYFGPFEMVGSHALATCARPFPGSDH